MLRVTCHVLNSGWIGITMAWNVLFLISSSRMMMLSFLDISHFHCLRRKFKGTMVRWVLSIPKLWLAMNADGLKYLCHVTIIGEKAWSGRLVCTFLTMFCAWPFLLHPFEIYRNFLRSAHSFPGATSILSWFTHISWCALHMTSLTNLFTWLPMVVHRHVPGYE